MTKLSLNRFQGASLKVKTLNVKTLFLARGGEAQPVKLFADCRVALTRCFLQALPVADVYLSPRILHQSGLVQDPSRQRHRGAWCAQHVSQEFMSDIETI